jgi:hypothetical protein
MRTSRALALSATAVAALGLAAPTAAAWTDPGTITASPSVIARGGQLTVTVDGTACQMSGSTVSSAVFPTTRLTPSSGDRSTARVTIDSNAASGSYSITARCGEGRSRTQSNAFTVIGGVRGGLGGSTVTGATPTDVAIGGGLVAAAAIGGAVFWMRRRSENRA